MAVSLREQLFFSLRIKLHARDPVSLHMKSTKCHYICKRPKIEIYISFFTAGCSAWIQNAAVDSESDTGDTAHHLHSVISDNSGGKQGDQGPMLWSQFSAIFNNFRQKNWRFSQNTNVMINFFRNLALFWVKNADFFANFFGENI
jgi:hypothetical protein